METKHGLLHDSRLASLALICQQLRLDRVSTVDAAYKHVLRVLHACLDHTHSIVDAAQVSPMICLFLSKSIIHACVGMVDHVYLCH